MSGKKTDIKLAQIRTFYVVKNCFDCSFNYLPQAYTILSPI